MHYIPHLVISTSFFQRDKNSTLHHVIISICSFQSKRKPALHSTLTISISSFQRNRKSALLSTPSHVNQLTSKRQKALQSTPCHINLTLPNRQITCPRVHTRSYQSDPSKERESLHDLIFVRCYSVQQTSHQIHQRC